MLQYELAPVGRSIVDSPELVDDMESQMANGTDDSTVFKDAPIFLRESLTFPYSYGLKFEVKLLEQGGKEKAFAEVLANPPHTTRQIMQPETYLSGEQIPPMPVIEFKRDFKDYIKFDIGGMGEFDVAVLVEQYAGKKLSERLYPEWRGGYYYAARPKGDATAPLGSCTYRAGPTRRRPLSLPTFMRVRWPLDISTPKKSGKTSPSQAVAASQVQNQPSPRPPRLDHGRRHRCHRTTRGYRAGDRERGPNHD